MSFILDHIRFLRALAARPRNVGAVAPSGPQLARAMAAQIRLDGPVLELGPGTGAITGALVAKVGQKRLTAIEYDPDFATGLTARVTVAELVPEIIDWARGPMAELAAGCLDDPRVTIWLGDVAAAIAEGRGRYDAILLDVDNGPDGLTRDANDGLYNRAGLASARAALRPGGVLAIWSAGPDAVFARRLEQAGFAIDEVKVRARQNGKGPTHVIWFATRD